MNKSKIIKLTILGVFLTVITIASIVYIPMLKFNKNIIYDNYDMKNSYEEFDKVYEPLKITKTQIAVNENHIIIPLNYNFLHPHELVYTLVYNPYEPIGSYRIDVFTYKRDSLFSQTYNIDSIYGISFKKYPSYGEIIDIAKKENLTKRTQSDDFSVNKILTFSEQVEKQKEQEKKEQEIKNQVYYGYKISEIQDLLGPTQISDPQKYSEMEKGIYLLDMASGVKWLIQNGYLPAKDGYPVD